MNEAEQEAIEYLNKYIKSDLFYEQEHYNRIEIVLNLINKLQKELQREKNRIMELAEMLDKQEEKIKFLETELELERNIQSE